MTNKISFKGIIIGAFSGILMTGIFFAMVLALFTSGRPDPKTFPLLIALPSFRIASFAVGATASIIAGYIAAHIARRSELFKRRAFFVFMCGSGDNQFQPCKI